MNMSLKASFWAYNTMNMSLKASFWAYKYNEDEFNG
jgi:hypothetical protein